MHNKTFITFMWTSNTSSQLQCGFQFQLNDFDTAERDECTFLSDIVTDEMPSEDEAFANKRNSFTESESSFDGGSNAEWKSKGAYAHASGLLVRSHSLRA